ncbi:hypothetical protein QQ045_024190 [Rhodiola kirilowii]
MVTVIHVVVDVFVPSKRRKCKPNAFYFDITFVCVHLPLWLRSASESRSICRYICDKYAASGNKNLFGLNHCAKASIDQWIEAEGQNFNPPSSVLVFQLAFAPRMKIKQDDNLIQQNNTKLAKVLDVYDKRLEDNRFLAGDEFSLADLSHLPNAQYLINGTDSAELFKSRKNVDRWWEEISSRESWKKVVEMQNSPSPRSH